ncbi:hypothetical protein MMC26_005933 [Xylographa opegraphella]|nr:hypothetical protein [Xylographa opegraphella]
MSSSMYRRIGEALPFRLTAPLDWQKGIAMAAKRTQRVTKIWSALSLVLEGFENSLESSSESASSDSKSLVDWMFSTLTASLKVALPMDIQDAEIFLQITQVHPQREQYLFHAVLPYVKKHMANIDSPQYFLETVFKSYSENEISKEVAINLHCDILSDLIAEWLRTPKPLDLPKKYPKSSDLVMLLEQCSSLGLRGEFNDILVYVMDSSQHSPVELFGSLWIPFLQAFLRKFRSSLAQPPSEYREVFHAVISNYIQCYLGQEPPSPTMTPDAPLGCKHCLPCDHLDRFLLNAETVTEYFRYSKPQRVHLEKQIRGRYKSWTNSAIGIPHTLIVTKNEAKHKAMRAIREYDKRCKIVQHNIRKMGIPKLNRLLGTTGHELIDFKSVRNKLTVAGRFRGPTANVT